MPAQASRRLVPLRQWHSSHEFSSALPDGTNGASRRHRGLGRQPRPSDPDHSPYCRFPVAHPCSWSGRSAPTQATCRTSWSDTPSLPGALARHEESIVPSRVVVAPPDHRIRGAGRNRAGSRSRGPSHASRRRPAVHLRGRKRRRVVGIVLSGGDGDGAEGLTAIRAHGGLAFVPDPVEAHVPAMPWSAIRRDHPDAPLTAEQRAERVAASCMRGVENGPDLCCWTKAPPP
ncbi:chemotaxis protein CheB [Methylobacterium sp. D54C]